MIFFKKRLKSPFQSPESR